MCRNSAYGAIIITATTHCQYHMHVLRVAGRGCLCMYISLYIYNNCCIVEVHYGPHPTLTLPPTDNDNASLSKVHDDLTNAIAHLRHVTHWTLCGVVVV